MERNKVSQDVVADALNNHKLSKTFDAENGSDIKQEQYSGICCGCLADHELRDINTTYYYMGKPEVYSELISYCFSIQVGEELDTPEKLYFICERCVRRLREAANFRTQIEVNRETFKNILSESKHDIDYISKHGEEEWLDEDVLPLDNEPQPDDGNHGDSDDDEKPLMKPRTGKAAEGRDKGRRLKKKKPRLLKIKKEDKDEEDVEGKKKASYKKYKRREELPYKLEKTDLECKICGETFPVHKGLQMHMPVHFPNHICEQCGRWFATRTQLSCHTVSHTTAVEACPICPNRVFKATGSLKAHMRRHEGQTDVYKCSKCKMRFPSFSRRRQHMVDFHGEEKLRYACKLCPNRYSLGNNLAAHVRNAHLLQRQYKCDICDKSFFVRSTLLTHMLRHTGEKTHVCGVCGKAFGRKHTLKEHVKIHTGEKAHVCSKCGKAFTQKATLMAHMGCHDKVKEDEFDIEDGTIWIQISNE